jgi:mannose-6-phosphate isomerase-like protein (cupin superfamily)
MGYELEALLGSARDLRRWKQMLPATVVCRLAGDLHLVPVTDALGRELVAHTGAPRLDEALRRWLVDASQRAAIAHVSGYEFGDEGDDVYEVWSGGQVVLGRCGEHAVADFFRDRRGLAIPRASFDIGRHRGESAAEKWAATARPEDQADGGAAANDIAGVDLVAKLATFSEHWQPRTVAQFNGHDVMVVKTKGEFVWHKHDDTDDFFLVLKGRLVIELRDGSVTLGPGEMFVVPQGVEHRPVADEEAHVLLIEPRGTPNTGNAATAAKRIAI